MRIRNPAINDQNNVDAVFDLIQKMVEDNPDIESAIWVAACSSCIAYSYRNSGLSYDCYKQEMLECSRHYKHMWEPDEE